MTTITQTPSIQSKLPVLVIGANGKTGRRVAQRLRDAAHPVKAASRSGGTRFDWQDRTTWASALHGSRAVYITYHPDLSFPGVADTIEAFAKLAVGMKVKRLVLLSGRGESGARDAERRIENSGADWTVVRCSVFNQNFSESFEEAIRHGHLAMPAAVDAKEPFVDAEDIADVVFAALTDDRHIGQLYELTGPRLLTMAQATETISKAVGRHVQYHCVTVDQYAEGLVEHGFAASEAPLLAQMIADVLDGRNAHLTDGVERALSRKPRDFADYARSAAGSGVWNLERMAS